MRRPHREKVKHLTRFINYNKLDITLTWCAIIFFKYLNMNKIYSFVLIVCVFFLSGCARDIYDLNIDYQYQGKDGVLIGKGMPSIYVEKVKDMRNVEDTRRIMHAKTEWQTATGGWRAEKPVADIITDALKQGLEKSNIKTSGDFYELIMRGELVDLKGDIISGFFHIVFKSELTVKFTLLEKARGKILWEDILTGYGETDSKSVVTSEKIEEVFQVALDNLIEYLLSDDYFLQQLTP